MYKIFIQERCLIITNNQPKGQNNIVFLSKWKNISFSNLNALISQYEAGEAIYLVTFYPEKVFKKAFGKLKYVEAAGGTVHSGKDILFIFRNGKWDLPKGKRDKGESIEQCAVREVEEECGLKDVEILNFIGITYHTYELKGKNYIKQTFWFNMKISKKQKLVPQTEEGISEAKWIKPTALNEPLSNTYLAIKEVLKLL